MKCIKTFLFTALLGGLVATVNAQQALTSKERQATMEDIPAGAVRPVPAGQLDKPNRQDDEIVELPLFTVTSEDDSGYFADKAMSSGRLSTELSDMSASIDVLTKEFLDDMGAIDIGDMMDFGLSTQLDNADFAEGISNIAYEGTGRSNITGRGRGLPLTRMVDYEEVDWDVDNFNVARQDTFLGTDAIMFGNGNPGGVTNFTKDQANLRRNWLGTTYRFGSFDESRITLDVNARIIPQRLSVRYEMLDHEGGSFRKFYYKKRKVHYFAVTFKPFRATAIRVNYETGKSWRQQLILDKPQDLVSHWWYLDDPAKFTDTPNENLGTVTQNAGAPWYYGGRNNSMPSHSPLSPGNLIRTAGPPSAFNDMPLDIYDYHKYSFAGPDSRWFQEYRDFRIVLEQRLAKDLYFRAHWRTSNADTNSRFIRRNGPVPTIYADPLPSTGGDDPYSGRLYSMSNWRQETKNVKREAFSATLAWNPNFGKWLGAHQASLTFEDRLSTTEILRYQEKVYQRDAEGNAVGAQDLRRVNYFDPNDDSTWHLGYWNPVEPFDVDGVTYYTGFLPLGDTDNGSSTIQRISRQSFIAHLQSHWFNRYLVTSIGWRRDQTDNIVLEPQSTVGSATSLEYYDPIERDPRLKTTAESMAYSGVLHLNKKKTASLFYGISDNVGNRYNGPVLPYAELPSEPEKATSTNYGVRFNFFDGKLKLRVSRYETSQSGAYVNRGYGWWGRFTRQGATGTGGNPANLDIDIPLASGGYITERYKTSARALDIWVDSISAAGFIDAQQKTLYDKIIARSPNMAQNHPGVTGANRENNAKGYEAVVQLQPFRHTNIIIKYAYNKTMRENEAADVSEWLDTIYSHVAQLPDAVLDAPFDINGTHGFQVNEDRDPGASYTNGEVFQATYASLRNSLEDIITAQTIDWGTQAHKFNVVIRQGITRGWLKGLSFGGAYNWASGIAQARTAMLSEDEQSLIHGKITGPSTWDARVFVTYKFTPRIFSKKVRASVQVNVNHLFNNDYEMQVLRVRTANTVVPGVGTVVEPVLDADGSLFPTRWRYVEPRTIFVRLGFEF